MARDVDPGVQALHPQVRNDHIKGLLCEQRIRLGAAERAIYHPFLGLEEHPQHAADLLIIIHDQEAKMHRVGSPECTKPPAAPAACGVVGVKGEVKCSHL
jgi:hypothetical protein